MSKPRDKGLSQYRKKRDPSKTTEPFEAEPSSRGGATRRGRFVVHCHSARALHYDLRIQIGGVLQSFAVPKGPSLKVEDKRLAIQTEPHPLRYLNFEGVIPEGNYGAGPMIVWDRGRVSYPRDAAEDGLDKGALSFELDGFKLKGRFSLVRPSKQQGDRQNQWLLMKREDAFASDIDVIAVQPRSVLSGLTVEELRNAERLYEEAYEKSLELGAKKGAVQASRTTPMLCALDDVPVDRPGWLYELKLDGVRILAERRDTEARLFFRTHRPATASFPEVVEALKTLLARDVVLDGEIITFDDAGHPSFQKLASRIHARRPGDIRFLRDAVPVVFVVFDILSLGDLDLRSLTLLHRKAVLEKVIRGAGVIRALDYFEDDGGALLAFCDSHGLEGLVAKRSDSLYRAGPRRSGHWIKVKRVREDDFIATGYTEGKGSRKKLGALELGTYQEGELRGHGLVGSGLSDREIEILLERLSEDAPVVVRVRYAGWTEDGKLRHPIYLGIRDDVAPEDVTLAPKLEDATMLDAVDAGDADADRVVGKARLTNQSKLFWPDDGITKGDLCNYYEAIAPVLLPHLHDRPVTLVRFPDGIEGKSFFQWRIPNQAPPWLRSLRLRSEEEDGKEVNTILVNDLSSLMYVANLGCIPLHVIASHAGALDICDFLTLDLDVELASLGQAIPIALTIREILEEVGLRGFPKTSGKAGLHVLVPLGEGLPWDAAKRLLELIGRLVLRRHPKEATMERRKDKRGARVLIDVGQTGRHRTIVAPYSVREVPGAPVSTPLSWNEISLSLDPSSFNIFTVPERALAS
ncbi:MAG: DNA ligase D, partial [Deltaproteobacteria bacterium]|nr:DNA ligase D [Deltaproteobacteria bacterium]